MSSPGSPRAAARPLRRARRLAGAVALSAAAAGIAAPSASALNYVTNANGDSWGVQDAAIPGVDTGSIRNTAANALQGYGGIRLRVNGRSDRMNGALLRGFGLKYDGVSRFSSEHAVEVGGVAVSRAVRIERADNWARWVDSFTNTGRSTVTAEVAFGGQLGYATGSNQSMVATTSSGDTAITAADGWAQFASPTTAAGNPSFNGPSATVTGTAGFTGALNRMGNFLRDPFANPLPASGDEANHYGFVNRLVLAPGQTRSIARFVVTGLSESRATPTGTAAPAAGTQSAAVRTTAASLASAPVLSDLSTGQLCQLSNWDLPKLGIPGFTATDCPASQGEPLARLLQAPAAVTSSPYDVTGKTMTQLQADMAAGATTAQQITRAYLDRIAAYDAGPLGLHSVLTVAGNAMAQAKAADAARAAGSTLPLLGMPILVKDIFDTKDMPTTGGSLLFDGYQPRQDAWQVAKLREAGAIILGKASLAEFAVDGHYSPSAYGQVWNAFDPSRSPIGSSGGSAAALAASFAAATLGTQTGDSLWGPASAASLYSLRGTDGMQSTDGVMPLTLIQDYAGDFARSLPDLAKLLQATAIGNPNDPLDDVADGRRPTDWAASLRADALGGKSIGVPATAFDDPFGTQGTEDALRAQFVHFTQAGATVKPISDPPPAPTGVPGDRNFEGWRRWIAAHPDNPYTEVTQIIRSPLRVPNFRITTPYTGTGPMTDAEVKGFQDYRANYRAILTRWMSDQGVDAVVFPGSLSDIHLNDSIQPSFGRRDPQSSASGLPTVIFPAGVNDHGQPITLQLQGRAFSDAELMGYAFAFDTRAKGHVETELTPPLAYRPGVETQPIPQATPMPQPITTTPRGMPAPTTNDGPQPTAPGGSNPAPASGVRPAPAGGPASGAQPARPASRRLVLARRTVTADRRGSFAVTVRCASSTGSCSGRVVVRRNGKAVASELIMVRAGRSRTVRIASPSTARRALARGTRVTYTVKLVGATGTRSTGATRLVVAPRS